MKILFLGYAISRKEADVLFGASVAGNKMQLNVISGLAEHSDLDMHIVTVYPTAAFPHEKMAYIKSADIEIEHGIYSHRIGFCNLPVIKQLWQTVAVYNYAKKHVDKNTVVFTFNSFPQVGLPAVWLKRKFGCRVCSLLADPPIVDKTEGENIIKSFLRKCFDDLTVKNISKCDSLVVLNKQAAIDYAPDSPYIVVEGGVEDSAILPLSFKKRQKKNIVYCGALTEYSGIMTLIDAMKSVTDAEAVLEIYGGGPLADRIDEISRSVTNIKFLGKVNNKEMLEIQRSAYLLVNPRPVDNAIARLTFPSKMFEYMLSGTPVLATKLNGLSNEFLEHIFYVEKGTAEELYSALNSILQMPTEVLSRKAEGAYDFIIREKTWSKQNERIYSFLLEECASQKGKS